MGSFRIFVNEIFDRQKADIVISKPHMSAEYYEREFTIGENTYSFYAEQQVQEFERVTGGTARLNVWSIEFQIHGQLTRYGITKTGRPLEVFQVVMEIMEDFLMHYRQHIDIAQFLASEISRKILYLKMIQRFAGPMGYAMIKTPTSNDKLDSEFMLIRNDLKNTIKLQDNAFNLSAMKSLKAKPHPELSM